MASGPGIITLENCLPINQIDIWNLQSGQPVTRPWTFSVQGEADIPAGSFYQNDTVLPGSSQIDARAVAMGYDGSLSISSGPNSGTELLQITQFAIRITVDTATIQPLKQLRRQRRVSGTEIQLDLIEYVVNDTLLLAQVIAPLLALSAWQSPAGGGNANPIVDPVISFQAQLATVTPA